MSIIVTPLNSPYTVNLAGTENLQIANQNIQTSGGAVQVILPSTPAVGAPSVTITCLNGSASISLASGANGISNASGFVSGTIANISAGSFFSASATSSYWLVK